MCVQKPLRILHLASSERWTGVAEPATSLARMQQQAGHETWQAVIWGRSFEEHAGALGARFARAVSLKRHINPFVTRAQVHALRRFIQQERIDVVHCHLLHDHWLAALAVRKLPDPKPLIVRTVHRYERMRGDVIHSWLFEKATGLIITVSTEQKALIAQAYKTISPRLKVIPGGVDSNRFRPDLPGAASVRADLGEKPDTPVAAIVAHLGYRRGHVWLLDAVPSLLEKVPKCTIWIVGQGEIRRRLREQIRDPKYHGRVVMAGYRTDDLPETYAAMDVGLLLALGSEGSGRAALEAMASGKPVIAVKKGSLVDTISDGVNGLLVPEGDVQGLADALARLLGDRTLAQQMGANARATVLERFTEQRRAESTIQAYFEHLPR